jgi:hypothetical protein
MRVEKEKRASSWRTIEDDDGPKRDSNADGWWTVNNNYSFIKFFSLYIYKFFFKKDFFKKKKNLKLPPQYKPYEILGTKKMNLKKIQASSSLHMNYNENKGVSTLALL